MDCISPFLIFKHCKKVPDRRFDGQGRNSALRDTTLFQRAVTRAPSQAASQPRR